MFNTIKNIANEVGTPFYIAHPSRFKDNIKNFRQAFLSQYDRFILSYSFKTNYTPFLLEIVKELGAYAEVVSEIEYDLALLMGFQGEHIVLNGPIKDEPLLRKAIINGSIIHLDCMYEVDSVLKIKEESPNQPIRVGLRINMEINTENGTSAVQGGLKESRFGFTAKALKDTISKLKSADIEIISLHGHTSSTNRVVDNYKIIASRLMEVISIHQLNHIKYIDLGGGFFGAAPKEVDISKKPTYQDYAQGICNVLLSNSDFQKLRPYIVIEPGASVVTNVFDIATQIYQRKQINNKDFIIVDASIYQVRPPAGKVNYPFEECSPNEAQNEITVDIVGSTCMEVDRISEQVKLSHYQKGDFLIYKGSGAYQNNLTPFFINPRCAIVELTPDGYKIIRKRQDAKHLLDLLQ